MMCALAGAGKNIRSVVEINLTISICKKGTHNGIN